MKQIQIDNLEDKIYALLMSNDEMGLGDMGNCREAAQIVISEWIEENNIIIEP